MVQETLDLAVIDFFQVGPKPCGSKVGPEDVVLERLPLTGTERIHSSPTAEFDVRVNAFEEFAL